MKKEFKIQGMKCEHCRMRVENAINDVAGVTAASVNLTAGKATVEGDFSDEDITDAVEDAGFSIDEP